MTPELVILGAGGSAGAIIEMVDDINRVSRRWSIRGLLDDDPSKHGTSLFGLRVLGPIEMAAQMDEALFVTGVASYRRPYNRAEIAARLGLARDRYATIIHPLASVSPDADIGLGVLVFQYATVYDSTNVRDHAYLSPFALVAHHSVVEAGAVMAPRSTLLGGARLGASAYAGSHSVVKDGVTIGEGAVLGMGAVVVDDVAAKTTVVGNPARPV